MEVAERIQTQTLRAGPPLEPEAFFALRKRAVLEGCKWDPQVGDISTLANFPLLIGRSAYDQLAAWAEQLSAETFSAEEEVVLERPQLLSRLGLPRRIRSALTAQAPLAATAARVIRFDFHDTADGWRISEANTDVPGGFTEATFYTALMGEHFPEAAVAGQPADDWADAIASHGKTVALLTATGYMEDLQIMAYLGRLLRQRGCGTYHCNPRQLTWCDGEAFLGAHRIDVLVRFYQGEWLSRLRRRCGWQNFFRGAKTAIANPGIAVISESKRFPLIWPHLRTDLRAWKQLLPETRDPREVNWRDDASWVLKTAMCNTGDDVVLRPASDVRRWKKIAREVRWFPGRWMAQRRFDTKPIATPMGRMFPCVGVYTIDGRACGAYGRLSRTPLIDYSAVDVPLLIEDEL
jgi:glutathionylspermidine synthase